MSTIEPMNNDRIIRFLTLDGVHQLYLVNANNILREIALIRPLSPLSKSAMAHMVCLALLRSNNLKGASQSLSFQIDVTSDLKKAIATANANGDVKGYVANPSANEVFTSSMISCTADLGLKTPYHSSVIVSGDSIEEQINSFFSQSDQTTLIYGSNIDSEDAEGTLALLYHHLPVEGGEGFSFDLAAAKKAIEEQKDADLPAIAKKIFQETPYEIVSEEPVRFHCDCSKKRFEGLLETLSDDDLKELANKEEPTETTCGWCGKIYSFSPFEIKTLLAKRNN